MTPEEVWRETVKVREYQRTQMARESVRSPLYRASAEEQRLKLEADLEAFAQAGGCIQCVPSGVSGKVDPKRHIRRAGNRSGRPAK